jgi:uncharacterized protein
MLLLGSALLTAACGRKGSPQPPLRIIPARTDDLRLYQQGTHLVLRMSHPRTTTAGRALPALEAVEVWQSDFPVDDPEALPAVDPAQFQATAQRRVALRGPELASAIEGDQIAARVITLEPPLEPPELRVFAVRTVPAGGEPSAFSNLARVVPRPPPPAPTELRLIPSQEAIGVRWELRPDGEEVVGFFVYRRLARARSYGEPLGTVGPAQRDYRDTQAELGNRYIYTVTSIGSRRPRRESAFAEEREIDYQDRFPPEPPAELVALPQVAGVHLVWRPSPAPDVAGYHVYRRDPAEESRRLTDQPVTELRFLDSGLAAGVTFRYRVTAVDHAGNEGEASAEAAAAAQ